jgi:uncharacterized protein (DUF3084 family)
MNGSTRQALCDVLDEAEHFSGATKNEQGQQDLAALLQGRLRAEAANMLTDSALQWTAGADLAAWSTRFCSCALSRSHSTPRDGKSLPLEYA